MNDFLGKSQFIWWQGVVEDIQDPLKLGRVRVRCLGFHTDNKSVLPTDSLPWAHVVQPITSAAINGIGQTPLGLVTGSWVIGFFRDGYNAQDPLVIGSIGGIPINECIPSAGFNDPSGKYPQSSHLDEPDTNRLARNEKIEDTIVKTKNENREKNIYGALNEDFWNEPVSPHAAKYPHNKVTETTRGHVFEVDDTLHNERIHEYHRSGTYREIHPDGSEVHKIVSNSYEIIAENNKIIIKGRKSENINNDYNLKVANNLNIEVYGNVNLLTRGSSNMETRGDFVHKVKGTCSLISEGNMLIMAPRIDLNPNGESPSNISDPVSDKMKNTDYAVYVNLQDEKKTITKFREKIKKEFAENPATAKVMEVLIKAAKLLNGR